MGYFGITEQQILQFSMILLRVSAFVVTWPVFGVVQVPHFTKILFALILTFLLFPIINTTGLPSNIHAESLIFLTIKESFIGLVMGYLARMCFYAMSIAGEIISTSVGLSNAQLFNPALGTMASPMEQFQVLLGTLLFLIIGGHHMMLEALNQSFIDIPVGEWAFNSLVMKDLMTVGQFVMTMGFKLAAPVVVAVLILNLALGIVGRAVPQLNVLTTSMPVNVLVGLVMLSASLPFFFDETKVLVTATMQDLMQFARNF